VAHVKLRCAGIAAIIRQAIAGGMPQHVWMHRKRAAGADAGERLAKPGFGERCIAFRDENVRAGALLALQLA
jgi:hypothetical protein